MHIEHLALNNFRNIAAIDLVPDAGFNIFWGENAQGKTNILEGIYLLGNLKSFRAARNEEMVRHETPLATLRGEVTLHRVRRRVELEIEKTGKKGRVDGKEVRSAATFLGHLCPVLFSPEEVGLVRGAPSGRRALLDRAIFQTEPGYLPQAQEYRRCLKQRNRLLKEKRSGAELAPWTEAIVRLGAHLRQSRRRYLERIRPLLAETYGNLCGGREEADIAYPAAASDVARGEEELRREAQRAAEREFALGQTLVGPHRDDIELSIDGRPLRLYGSQGQQRSFILAFKTAQIIDLEKIIGETPVLLLDDMTSELDRRRQNFFFDFLKQRRGQVFITTTDTKTLEEVGFADSRFFRIVGGSLEESR